MSQDRVPRSGSQKPAGYYDNMLKGKIDLQGKKMSDSESEKHNSTQDSVASTDSSGTSGSSGSSGSTSSSGASSGNRQSRKESPKKVIMDITLSRNEKIPSEGESEGESLSVSPIRKPPRAVKDRTPSPEKARGPSPTNQSPCKPVTPEKIEKMEKPGTPEPSSKSPAQESEGAAIPFASFTESANQNRAQPPKDWKKEMAKLRRTNERMRKEEAEYERLKKENERLLRQKEKREEERKKELERKEYEEYQRLVRENEELMERKKNLCINFFESLQSSFALFRWTQMSMPILLISKATVR